jgi:DNA-binding NarL/FixJ family response regulator
VLELLASGHSNDEVADQLNLSVNTVKYHVRGLYRRLGVHTRAQATRALVERREHAVG